MEYSATDKYQMTSVQSADEMYLVTFEYSVADKCQMTLMHSADEMY